VLSYGVYPEASLKEARIKRDASRKLLADGIDPSAAKKAAKRDNVLKTENLFEAIALEWHDKQKEGWTERHANYVLARMKADLFNEIGNMPINEIKAPDLLAALQKIEDRGALDIAKRARQTCGQIFRYAVVTGRAERDIAVDLKGALKVGKTKHHAHLEESELPELIAKIKTYDGDIQTKLAIQFTLLTFVRTGEVRGAEWSEFDFEKKEWRIPVERIKMRTKNIVPLSKQTLELLEQLQLHSGQGRYLFPNTTNRAKCMSENTMLYAIYRMGYPDREINLVGWSQIWQIPTIG
jgi:integrase